MTDLYPEQTKLIARACARLGLAFHDLDEGRGYLFAISDGKTRIVSGTGSVCAYPLNASPAFAVSRDKAHTNAVLTAAGVAHVPGKLYFVTERHAALRPPGREIVDAIREFPDEPRFCKPNAGARGDFAEAIASRKNFISYIERVKSRYEAILVQPVVEGDEYRVFCLDGEAVFATLKSDFTLTGDGASGVGQLLARHNAAAKSDSISPIDEENFLNYLRTRGGIARDHVPETGARVSVPGRRNLSAGGDVRSFTTDVPRPLAELAVAATQAITLRVSGVDIFDLSPGRDLSDLAVLEVNGNPAIATLSRIGREDLAEAIWCKILLAAFR
jgi:cyanophycin synthetase